MASWLAKHGWPLVIGGIVIIAGAYLATSLVIGRQVESAIAAAQLRHDGEPVAALIAAATDGELELAQRNRAIWALGQLGAPEAVPVLESLRTGEPCDHEHAVCQREVAKGLDGCRGSFNAGAIVWRHGDLAVR